MILEITQGMFDHFDQNMKRDSEAKLKDCLFVSNPRVTPPTYRQYMTKPPCGDLVSLLRRQNNNNHQQNAAKWHHAKESQENEIQHSIACSYKIVRCCFFSPSLSCHTEQGTSSIMRELAKQKI